MLSEVRMTVNCKLDGNESGGKLRLPYLSEKN